MAQPVRDANPAVARPSDTRALQTARVFHSILADAKKSPGEYVRIWNVSGGAE